MMAPTLSPKRRASRGVSLVELMVALALGLFVVAVATTLLAGQLRETRQIAREVRLMQELRAVADLMTRDLRRAGYWGHAAAGVWQPGDPAAPAVDPYGPAGPFAATSVGLRYSRDAVENDAVDPNEQFGYRLRAGTIELQLGAGNWQALTDPATMTVTAFALTAAADAVDLGGSCVAACPPGAANCPPRLMVQSVDFTITARSVADPRVVRSLRASVRPRNDTVAGVCPAV